MGESTTFLRRGVAVCGSFVLNTLIAVFGVGALETQFGATLRPHSIPMVLCKASSLSLVFGALLGFAIYKIFGTRSAKWVWSLPLLFFVGRVILLVGTSFSWGYVWRHVSGMACVDGEKMPHCGVDFFAFTIPTLRSSSYSMGAYLAQRASPKTPSFYHVFRSTRKRLEEL